MQEQERKELYNLIELAEEELLKKDKMLELLSNELNQALKDINLFRSNKD